MVTRRIVLGAGMAFMSLACTAGLGAYTPIARRRNAQVIDALFIDAGIDMPCQLATFIKASRQTLPVVSIHLDAASHAGLKQVLDNSQAIVGISSGATLFCLERIAWDHGFRLTGRSQHCVGASDQDARQDVTAFPSGAHPAAPSPSILARAYRPSRADGTLHIWVMKKSAREA
jgi:hypothetical protein